MTIHLGWMTPVWILAGIGALLVLYIIFGLIGLIFYRE